MKLTRFIGLRLITPDLSIDDRDLVSKLGLAPGQMIGAEGVVVALVEHLIESNDQRIISALGVISRKVALERLLRLEQSTSCAKRASPVTHQLQTDIKILHHVTDAYRDAKKIPDDQIPQLTQSEINRLYESGGLVPNGLRVGEHGRVVSSLDRDKPQGPRRSVAGFLAASARAPS